MIMHKEDYGRFSKWLEGFRSEEILNFDQLLELYYADGNPEIRFAPEEIKDG